MRTLIVGGSGFLGAELTRRSLALGHPTAATYRTRPGGATGADWRALDIRDRAAVAALVAELRPEAVINAAFRQDDWVTTADGAASVALAAAATGARCVHVSSDAVFSGAAARYPESAVPDPITPYGAAKAAAETAVRAIVPGAVVARTSLIVGDGGSVHERRIHALLDGRDAGALFTDDVRCPVHVADLAAALLELAGTREGGVRHVAGADAISRYDLGVLVARRDGRDPGGLVSARRIDAGIPGPVDVRLDCAATRRGLSTRLRGAHEFLARPAPDATDLPATDVGHGPGPACATALSPASAVKRHAD